ncbi:MAG: HD domain-containing protein [Phycisphaerales bacterium]|nr:HD domain-containing protein [Planctomycetota bacterium]MBL6997186.1 HD domain-containing protein [Phycisphaerales bacterium]
MTEHQKLVLETLHGPVFHSLMLDGDAPITIGRGAEHTLALPSGATVSRNHAVIVKHTSDGDPIWKIQDSGSRHGTFINGIKLKDSKPIRLHPGDLITIEPFTFQIIDRNAGNLYSETFDDAKSVRGTSILRIDRTQSGVKLAQERLQGLLECSRIFHASESETDMALAIATAASAGTLFRNVAILRAVGGDRVEILATKGRVASDGSLNISRSLLDAAMEGEPVRFQKTEVIEQEAQSIMQYNIEEALCVPIMIGKSVAGCIYLDNREGQARGETADEDIEYCTGLAEIASLAMSNLKRADIERRYTEERHGFLLGTVSALVNAIDAKDTYTCGHSERVAWLSKELAQIMELDSTTIEQVHICGLVHDIGKIGIPEAILRKPGRLTDEEFNQIRAHPVIGENILREVHQLHSVLPGVRSHHERWDGGGYPDGTKGEETPLFGRILGIADAFDAMCSSRSYREKMSRSEVLEEITACAGSQFDPELAELFLKINFIHYDVMIDFHISQASI